MTLTTLEAPPARRRKLPQPRPSAPRSGRLLQIETWDDASLSIQFQRVLTLPGPATRFPQDLRYCEAVTRVLFRDHATHFGLQLLLLRRRVNVPACLPMDLDQ